jgi:hypothetical protein
VSAPAEVWWVALVESGTLSAPAEVRWAVLVERLGRNSDGSENRNNDGSEAATTRGLGGLPNFQSFCLQ